MRIHSSPSITPIIHIDSKNKTKEEFIINLMSSSDFNFLVIEK